MQELLPSPRFSHGCLSLQFHQASRRLLPKRPVPTSRRSRRAAQRLLQQSALPTLYGVPGNAPLGGSGRYTQKVD